MHAPCGGDLAAFVYSRGPLTGLPAVRDSGEIQKPLRNAHMKENSQGSPQVRIQHT